MIGHFLRGAGDRRAEVSHEAHQLPGVARGIPVRQDYGGAGEAGIPSGGDRIRQARLDAQRGAIHGIPQRRYAGRFRCRSGVDGLDC